MTNDVAAHSSPALGMVMTVTGPIASGDLGVTLAHEHLIAIHQGPLVDTVDPVLAREELERARRWGVRSVVDMTNVGLGRDPVAIRDIARRSDVQVVMGSGFYKDGWLPGWVHDLGIAEMAEVIVRDLVEGVDGTTIRAGVIGEIGVSRTVTPTEERSLAAAARAQRRTGAAVNVHFDIGSTLPEYHHALDILAGEGGDLARVVVDHFVCRPDEVSIARELTARGPYVEFDLWGMETWPKILELTGHVPPEVQIASLRWFVAAGLRDHLLIAHDVANVVNQRARGGYGQSHITRNLLARFREHGITDDDIETLLVRNPMRLFAAAGVVGE